MRGARDVVIAAQSGARCGAAILRVTSATDDDWTIGASRYNDGILLGRTPDGQLARLDGGDQAASTNCHGPHPTDPSLAIYDYTPLQAGGFADSDLAATFLMGVVPPGSYFDNSIISQSQWSALHRWDMPAEQAKGVVVYMRSFTPLPAGGQPKDAGTE